MSAETPENVPSEAERKGKRGHDDNGSVRPADGRYGLHEPDEESTYCGPEAPAVQTADTADTKSKRGKR